MKNSLKIIIGVTGTMAIIVSFLCSALIPPHMIKIRCEYNDDFYCKFTKYFYNKTTAPIEYILDGIANPFRTSNEHRQEFGIETARLSFKEKRELHSMIEQTIMAGFQYYDTGDEKEFKKIKDLFLIEEYERIKNSIKKMRDEHKKRLDAGPYPCKIPSHIPNGKFSKPREYKDLENRIGIMVLHKMSAPDILGGGCESDPLKIYIFKRIDNIWKIEKINGARIGWPIAETTENYVIKKLIEENKKRL